MKDRFKFRLYDKVIGEMAYNICVGFIKDDSKTDDWVCADTSCGQITYRNSESKYIVLMQSTGLKDKNGKLAYEGDIVELRHLTGKNCDKHEKFVITENAIGTGFQLNPLNSNACGYRHIHRLQYDYTIIGNKYETPELLED